MKGLAYGVGVGPGDPEYMTLKAVRLIRENQVIALPGLTPRETTAYQIAVQAVPELEQKELVPVHMPMVKDRKLIDAEHRKGAKLLESYLDQGKNVVFLTLGDPSIYCTFSYLQHYLEADGYQVELVSGRDAVTGKNVSAVVAAGELFIPLGDLVDFEKEVARLTKELEGVKKEIGRSQGMLGNPGFLNKAPVHLVQQEKEKLEAARARATALENRIAELKENV